ncbi:MAG: rhodanese-like domain-containing protein [Candidatus Kapabacteria bacterium]|nr:rhodanese-like domain-containing protein [Ignavibacteriota bacterium]MCW5885208.1 rhodanese-like domain-containing protein [Candidatus Kapabacteria bacterium]
MLKNIKFWALLLGVMFIVSCSDDDNKTTPTKEESLILAEYIEANGDYINTTAPAMIDAKDVKALMATPGKVLIVDIRTAADFEKGHIEGAVNVTIPEALNYIKTVNAASFDKIVVACYTGQSASYVTSLYRILGYNNAVTLKWGHCSWHKDFDRWTPRIGNSKATMMVQTVTEKPAAGKMPTITTGKSTGKDILEARATSIIAEGYGPASISADDVFANLNNFHIVNYWPNAQYLDPGHIPGAMNYLPKTDLKVMTNLKTLPTDKPIVVYCYTGQTSSHVAAYLRLLGYDAKSLSFGANGMMYDAINGKAGFTTWKESYIEGYDYVK